MDLQPLWTASFFFGALFGGTILVLAGVKAWNVWRTRNWPQAIGKVVESRVASRRVGTGSKVGGSRMANFPRVVFEYTVDGRVLRNDQVNVTPHVADADVEEVLDRYPLGTEVTVFYNPANPKESVLEREWPRWLGVGVLGLVGAIALVSYGVPWAATNMQTILAGNVPRPEKSGLAIMLAGVGVFVLMLAETSRRQAAAAWNWPSVIGRIDASYIEAFFLPRKNGTGPRLVSFRPKVVYIYEISGRTYRGERISLGANMSGSQRNLISTGVDPRVSIVDRTNGQASSMVPPRWMQDTVLAHNVGAEREVFYNPEVPSEALLNRARPKSTYVLFAIGLALLAGAAYVVGILEFIQ